MHCKGLSIYFFLLFRYANYVKLISNDIHSFFNADSKDIFCSENEIWRLKNFLSSFFSVFFFFCFFFFFTYSGISLYRYNYRWYDIMRKKHINPFPFIVVCCECDSFFFFFVCRVLILRRAYIIAFPYAI